MNKENVYVCLCNARIMVKVSHGTAETSKTEEGGKVRHKKEGKTADKSVIVQVE